MFFVCWSFPFHINVPSQTTLIHQCKSSFYNGNSLPLNTEVDLYPEMVCVCVQSYTHAHPLFNEMYWLAATCLRRQTHRHTPDFECKRSQVFLDICFSLKVRVDLCVCVNAAMCVFVCILVNCNEMGGRLNSSRVFGHFLSINFCFQMKSFSK